MKLHENGIKRVLHYLMGTMPNEMNQIKWWADASWEGEHGFVRKIQTGVAIQYAGVSIYTVSVCWKPVH